MELAERMAATVSGQVTWADPSKGQKCIMCRHVGKHPKPVEHKPDICNLVRVHTKKNGLPFSAKKAIACSMFSI